MIFKTIQARFTWYSMLVILLLLLLITSATYSWFRYQTTRQIYSQQMALLTSVADGLDDKLFSAHTALQRVAGVFPEQYRSDRINAQRWLHDRTGLRSIFSDGLYLVGADNIVLAENDAAGLLKNKPFSYNHGLDAACFSSKSCISKPYLCAVHKTTSILMTAPIVAPDGRTVATLVGAISIESPKSFFQTLVSRKAGESGYLFLFDQQQTILAHPDQTRLQKTINSSFQDLIASGSTNNRGGSGEITTFYGVPSIASFRHLRSTSIFVASVLPQQEAYAPITRFRNGFLVGIVVILLVAAVMYRGLSRLLLSPLHELHRAATSYGKGDLNARTPVRSNDEIGMLAATMNKMAEQIAEKIRDVEASKTALQESEAFRRRIFESSALPITIIDATTMQFIDCNPATLEANGFKTLEEFRGKSVLDLAAPTQYDGTPSDKKAEQYLKAVLQEGQIVVEWRHQRADGEQWDGEVHLVSFNVGNKLLIQTTTLDITERKKTAALMVQTEKMMMVGGLAAGMAHEINNPLGIISQTAQNIQRRLDPGLPANQVVAKELGLDLATLQQYLEARQIFSFIKSIREATDRAARIISNMLRFSRKSESHTEYVALDLVFDQVLELAASDYDLKKNYDFKRITIQREFNPDLPPVPISVLEVEQVLLNLMKNAAQAMYEASTPNPQIWLRTRRDQDFVVIEVEDNGPGMLPEVQKRIFEPFYSTKEVGKGTGLGLSVSYAIITNNHNGRLEVHSQPGNGTCFIIRLPLLRHSAGLQGASS